MSVVSHWYFNASAGQTVDDSVERFVLIGGYGGFPKTTPYFDGIRCRPDIWISTDGANWIQASNNATFGARAWHGSAVLHAANEPRLDISPANANGTARLFIFGGGNIGFGTASARVC